MEKKALMDDCPSKDVYHQLQSLSKHNPCFVQSLQSIMSQNIMAEESPDTAAPSDPLSSNQAVLALLLAAHLKPSQGVQQGAASLTGLIKQLEAGTSAVELLKSALALCVVLVGFRIGELLRKRVSQDLFRKIVLFAFLLMGLRLIANGLM